MKVKTEFYEIIRLSKLIGTFRMDRERFFNNNKSTIRTLFADVNNDEYPRKTMQ